MGACFLRQGKRKINASRCDGVRQHQLCILFYPDVPLAGSQSADEITWHHQTGKQRSQTHFTRPSVSPPTALEAFIQ